MRFDEVKISFYRFLNRDISTSDLENYIYSNPNLEVKLGYELYIKLIGFDFKDKSQYNALHTFIREQTTQPGEYETWRLQNILQNLITDTANLNLYLQKLYDLYCGEYSEQGLRKYEFKFLANLALNNLYWLDEVYLQHVYGATWEAERKKCLSDFDFYHKQLTPFAEQILTALNTKDIEIFNDGTYQITPGLRNQLETKVVYQLQHPT